ncbi:hypothetical protein [Novosphingobium sp.]|uniref:hypothetical protein n=1 Tax=Novosphingobium sp. TaxID=1874826 RepID=UPI0035B37050
MPYGYNDILERISERPTWWWRGVPRYGAFHPALVTLAGGEVLLVNAKCNLCDYEFRICTTGPGGHWTFRDRIDVHASIGLGNAPSGCCGHGVNFLLCERKVEEFWEWREDSWVRQTSWELPLLDFEMSHIQCVEEKLKTAGVYSEWENAFQADDAEEFIKLLPHFGLSGDKVELVAQNWRAVVRDIDDMFQPRHAKIKKGQFFDRGWPCEPWYHA